MRTILTLYINIIQSHAIAIVSLCSRVLFIAYQRVSPANQPKKVRGNKQCFSFCKDTVEISECCGEPRKCDKLFACYTAREIDAVINMTSCRGFLICVLYFIIIVDQTCISSAVEVNMEGTGYITYDLRSNSIATKTNHITFSFKTFRPSGLMVHSSGSQGDFITIELIHGQLRQEKIILNSS